MSAAASTLERVAELLPEEQRQKFFATIATFKQVPEDDEYLLTLEAIGFMTLLWHQVPNQIKDVMAGAQPAAQPTTEYLASEIRKSIQESLNLPSHEDLRQLVHELGEQQTKFVQSMKGFERCKSTHSSQGPSHGFLLGAFVGATFAVLALFVVFPSFRSDLRNLPSEFEKSVELPLSQNVSFQDKGEDRVLCQRQSPIT